MNNRIINVIIEYSQPTLIGKPKVNYPPKDQPRQIVVTVGMVRWYANLSDRITTYYRPTRSSFRRAQRCAHMAQLNQARLAW